MNQATKSKYVLKRLAFAAPSKWLKKLVKDIRKEGYEVRANWPQGYVEAFNEGHVILRAFEVKHGHWFVKGASEVFTADEPGLGDKA